MSGETIFALSSGMPPAGVAVIRASGPGIRFGLETLAGHVPAPRIATLATLRDRSGGSLDRALILYFAAPGSFTGEDVAELHVHGGRAVVAATLSALASLPGYRPAEAGEFTRRAFANGKADLTEVEGLSDLIAAETEAQRRQAVGVAGGAMRKIAEDWRARLIQARAYLEAELDFSDEDDVPELIGSAADEVAEAVAQEMEGHLRAADFGERVRSGFEVVLLGAPNVGKSSLLNALARRDVAIVTAEAGTTRDMIEVAMDLEGYAVTLVDTAGLRETTGLVESEGVRRARVRGGAADLVLVLSDGEIAAPEDLPSTIRGVIRVRTKTDLARIDSGPNQYDVAVSAANGSGLGDLKAAIVTALGLLNPRPAALITRERQRRELGTAVTALRFAVGETAAELKAERLRQAGDAIGRLTGRIDVDEWLDVIFREFCIGK
ncbi:tRNA uridine-5-carboxymethylaminomethyl(34) synthesis GTPase MnmE [Kaistia algarum]|uniref:tRNA uridine-5-carboxymethylaminomethyl(34) synthesis GTPase MnmE n=1 Tax=Kaistia algarum TaxID=2083279 RepID=UPI0014031BD5|nr:tRNA uridine-5-carboxymethylaminomethyl(34) synthesis GTPase MnmE [Kaistia algarum]MCX5513864.1 tRNA uridine-5-carboxymethylaminomethyl(34) synthesis GTPase MnmE [Kaistia algarum]